VKIFFVIEQREEYNGLAGDVTVFRATKHTSTTLKTIPGIFSNTHFSEKELVDCAG